MKSIKYRNLVHLNNFGFRTDEDIKETKKLVELGEIISLTTADTIKDSLKVGAEHFFEAEFFQTVEDKTKRMIQGKVIPQYMIDFYNK